MTGLTSTMPIPLREMILPHYIVCPIGGAVMGGRSAGAAGICVGLVVGVSIGVVGVKIVRVVSNPKNSVSNAKYGCIMTIVSFIGPVVVWVLAQSVTWWLVHHLIA